VHVTADDERRLSIDAIVAGLSFSARGALVQHEDVRALLRHEFDRGELIDLGSSPETLWVAAD
jgi:predicted transcriptional regulator